MTRKLLLLILATAISVAAHAHDTKATATLLADLDAVTESGIVEPVDGLTTAGQPNEAALKVFAEQGYTTVIDLRTAGEDRGMDEPAVVDALGMDYILMPIGRDGITFDNARKLDELIKGADGPVLLHCGSSNRVGALLALSKSNAGADDEVALQFGREAGLTSLEGRVEEVLQTE